MSCDRWVDAISAIADGEDPGIDIRLVDAHVARCVSCRDFRATVDATRRRIRIQEAPSMPDLSRRVAKLGAIADRASRWSVVRGLLVVTAVQIIVLSIPEFVLGDADGSSPHGARHLGAFGIAYAVGLVVVAVRPARARTMLPVAGVLGLALGLSAVVDLFDGAAALGNEVAHLPEMLSVLLLWLLARPAGRSGDGLAAGHASLRVAGDEPGPRREAM